MESQPYNPSPAPAPSSGGNERMYAIASLVLGIINLCAWFIPLCGAPLSIVGLVLGYLGMKDPSQKTLAIVGMVLSGLGLFATCINGAVGAYMGLTGQGFQFSP